MHRHASRFSDKLIPALSRNRISRVMSDALDLVGGPFAVLESDPCECNYYGKPKSLTEPHSAVFTILLRKLGMSGLEVVEIYDIEPWAVNHLDIRGLIFCYPCGDDGAGTSDAHDDVVDPDADDVWFAHQLSTDACASQAILNVALNLEGVDMSPSLREFYQDTERMSPLVRRSRRSRWMTSLHGMCLVSR